MRQEQARSDHDTRAGPLGSTRGWMGAHRTDHKFVRSRRRRRDQTGVFFYSGRLLCPLTRWSWHRPNGFMLRGPPARWPAVRGLNRPSKPNRGCWQIRQSASSSTWVYQSWMGDLGEMSSLAGSFVKFGDCAAGHRIQLAIRERAMIFERREVRSVLGLAHDLLHPSSADLPIAGAPTSWAQRSVSSHCEPVHRLHPNPTFRDGHHRQRRLGLWRGPSRGVVWRDRPALMQTGTVILWAFP
jgi:hypothetical protein